MVTRVAVTAFFGDVLTAPLTCEHEVYHRSFPCIPSGLEAGDQVTKTPRPSPAFARDEDSAVWLSVLGNRLDLKRLWRPSYDSGKFAIESLIDGRRVAD